VLHADDRPTSRGRFVEPLVQFADVRLAVVGKLSLGIGVMGAQEGAAATTRFFTPGGGFRATRPVSASRARSPVTGRGGDGKSDRVEGRLLGVEAAPDAMAFRRPPR
jgi:hypothetical protein